MNVLEEDIYKLSSGEVIPWELLRNRRILVTGATGLIGSLIVRALAQASELRSLNLRISALVRSRSKGQLVLPAGTELIEGDIEHPLLLDGGVDYIVHAACPTASEYFVSHPAETRRAIVEGTSNVIVLAEGKRARMVYLSSMEVYGKCETEEVDEASLGWLDAVSPRNSYPIGKRVAEQLCKDAAMRGVDVSVARPVQTFGAGISPSENRVFAQFARAVIDGADIELKTDGTKAHCFCYTTDCVAGILCVLLKGEKGEVYNISNENTFCTIREMAEGLVGKDRVRIKLSPGIYPPSTRMRVSSKKLRKLGWKPTVDLEEMYARLIRWMRLMQESQAS